jgi:transposase
MNLAAAEDLRCLFPSIGNRWLKATLVQAGWGASRSRNSYLACQNPHLVGRRGKERALVAVGHSILAIFYHMTRRAACYTDLGGDFFERLEPNRLKRHYVHRLKRLGYTVALESSATA